MSKFDGEVPEWSDDKLQDECAKLGTTLEEIKEEAEELDWSPEYLIYYKKKRRNAKTLEPEGFKLINSRWLPHDYFKIYLKI